MEWRWSGGKRGNRNYEPQVKVCKVCLMEWVWAELLFYLYIGGRKTGEFSSVTLSISLKSISALPLLQLLFVYLTRMERQWIQHRGEMKTSGMKTRTLHCSINPIEENSGNCQLKNNLRWVFNSSVWVWISECLEVSCCEVRNMNGGKLGVVFQICID